MIYAVVKKYAVNGNDDTFKDWHYKASNHDSIYDKMMELTDGDHMESANAASWCELASEGEIYEFDGGEIEIVDFD